MYKLKVGIPISSDYNPLSGGSFSYTNQLTKAIDNYNFNDEVEIVFLNFEHKNISTLKPLISFHPFGKYNLMDLIRKCSIQFLKKIPLKILKRLLEGLEAKHTIKRDKNIINILKENDIHILFYLNPDGHTYNFPFITTHWDVGHLSTYMFPEFAEDFIARKNYYKNILPKALMIITETETGKKELIKHLPISEERIAVMPIFPGEVINENITQNKQKIILKDAQLEPKKFFLYPAQFWAHKNHTLLIDAFEQVIQKHSQLNLVFTGSDKGNLEYIKSYIHQKKLDDHIKILGFVSNEQLFAYYKNAIALVMPTFLGPSNMPPLEAAFLGCPVLLSDMKGHRELLGDYGKYFDPHDVNALSQKMLNQLEQKTNNEFLYKENFNIDSALIKLENIFSKITIIRKTWI